MATSMREYRAKIKSTESMKKITRAMELIAASRVIKAQQQAAAATPYARELTRAVSALATFARVDHPLTTEPENARRAAVLVVTSDRGLAGAYSGGILKEAERLRGRLEADGKEAVLYVSGRKGVGFYRFRRRPIEDSWTGFSDRPKYSDARVIGDALVGTFLDEEGVDEVHVVFSRFKSMLIQTPEVIRLMPLMVVEGEDQPEANDVLPLYEFEPSASDVLDALLPRYVYSRIYFCLLQAAASELASRQRAMKAATDNAEDLIHEYTRIANQARQAGITQEISEIVGGANALADANAGSE